MENTKPYHAVDMVVSYMLLKSNLVRYELQGLDTFNSSRRDDSIDQL